MSISDRVAQAHPSMTIVMTQKARALKSQGFPVLSLSIGEPHFDTPVHIRAAAKHAMDTGHTKYTPVTGTPDVKAAIRYKFSHDNQLDFQDSEIMVSTGCKQCLYNLAQALLNPGDEALIPSPYWVSYPEIVRLAGAKASIIETDDSMLLTPDKLEEAITPQSKLLWLNSPNNPSGQCYSAKDWLALGEVIRGHPQLWVVSDDIYEHLYWHTEPFTNLLMVCPDLRDRMVIAHGVSKTYAMTGWRLGYAAGPKSMIQAMTLIQSQSTSGPNSIAQAAACAALTGPQVPAQKMRDAMHKNHDVLYQGLSRLPGLRLKPAQGTFYLFVNFSVWIQAAGCPNDVAFCEWLLEHHHMALVPGSAFGKTGYARISYATSPEIVEEALSRFACVADSLFASQTVQG